MVARCPASPTAGTLREWLERPRNARTRGFSFPGCHRPCISAQTPYSLYFRINPCSWLADCCFFCSQGLRNTCMHAYIHGVNGSIWLLVPYLAASHTAMSSRDFPVSQHAASHTITWRERRYPKTRDYLAAPNRNAETFKLAVAGVPAWSACCAPTRTRKMLAHSDVLQAVYYSWASSFCSSHSDE